MTQTGGMNGRSAGWYADPVTVGAARYWDGRGWTDLVAWGGTTRHDPTALGDIARLEAISDAATVSRYLADAVQREVVAPAVANMLRLDVEQRVPGSVTTVATAATSTSPPPTAFAVPATPSPTPERVRPTPPTPQPSMAPPSTRTTLQPPAPPEVRAAPPRSAATTTVAEPVQALPRQPGRFAHWWSEAQVAVRSDLALHGLAYLGVLLLFAGVTGLITFSFGDVAPWVRAFAEFMVPSALFVSAWYLQRRGASIVGASLTLLGGAITPITVAASLTDGAPFPPDLSGRSLPIMQGVAVGLVAIVMAFVARRSPSSPLRFIAGPALWMAAGLAAGVWRDPVPSGYDTARPDSLQLAVILAALTVTVLLCSWRRIPVALADATRLVALPMAAVVYVLELVLAGDEDWPLAGTIVVGLGALLLLELMSERLRSTATSVLQFVVVAVAATRLAAEAAPEWVAMGAAIVLLALVEYVGWRRPVRAVTLAGLALSGSAFLLTLSDTRTTASAFGAMTVWGLWRYVRPAEWLPSTDDVGVVPAAAASVATGALWDLSEHGPAVIVTAALVLAIAVAGRLWRPIADDSLWRWFVPAAAGAVSVISMSLSWGEMPVEVAIATAMLAGALALSALPIAARVWATSAVVVWSLANTAEALGIDRNAQAVCLAAAALALLVGSLVVAKPICVHLAVIGHVAGLAALAAPTWPGWAATAVVGAATVGWWATTIVDERGEAVHLATLRSAAGGSGSSAQSRLDVEDLIEELAPLVSLLGLWATVMLTFDAAGWVAGDDPWAAAVSGGVVLVGACVVRLAPWRRARRLVLAWATLVGAAAVALVAISAAGSDRGHWSPVVCLALGLAVVGVTAAPRPLGFTWTAWVGGAVLTVFLADRLGLDRDWTDVALAGWGAVALLGALTVHRVHFGPLPVGKFVSDRLLLPPAILGAGAFVIGGVLGLSEGNETGIGWTAAGMSVVVLAVAILLPLGALVVLAEALATAAYVLLAPWEPLDRPWTFLPWALLLLDASLATRRSGEWSPARWDLPSFVVAHGVAMLALIAAIESDTVVATYAGFGAVAVAIAVVLRRWPWAAAGAALVLVAGLDAGHGWLALVLLIEGIALTVVGQLRTQIARSALLAMGAMAIIGAWFDVTTWQSWATSTVFYATVPASAVVALAAVVGFRSGRVPRELAGVWAIAGSLLVFGTAAVGLDEVARRPGGLILAGSLLVLAAAAALTAVVLGAGMRWIAAGLAAAAWAPAAWALEVSDTVATLVGTAVALAGLAAALVVHRRQADAMWLHPGTFYASATQLAAAIAALDALPDRDPLIVVLLAVSAELIAFGVLSRRSELYVLSPLPAFGAWLLYAADVLAGDTSWWAFYATMPASAMIAFTAAVGLRSGRVPRELAGAWAIAGSLLVFGTAAVGLDEVARRPGGLILAGSLLVLAVAAALTAVVLGAGMRWLAAALAAAAWVPAAWALEVSDAVATLVGTAVALVGLAVALVVHRRQPTAVWLHPGIVYASATQFAAAIAALDALPDRDLLIVVLLAVSAELVAFGVLSRRSELFVLSPLPACGAWLLYAADALAGDASWWAFYATMPASAVIALAAAAGLRSGRMPRGLAWAWATAGGLVVFGTAAVGLDEVARRPGGLILAGSLLVLAAAAATTAAVAGTGMRWIAAALAAAAWAPAAWAFDVSDTTATLVGTTVALAGLTAALLVNGRRPDAVWLHPGIVYASATQLAAAIAALGALPDRDLLIVVLLAVSAELVAFGVLSRRSELYVFSPIPACGAWLLYAADALAGEANWFTVPIGLTLLVMVGLVRWIRRGRGGDPAAYDVIVLEFIGMSFLVASALARTLAGHLWNGVLAIGIGVLVAGWGVVTRVRWRAGFGAAGIVLATVLLIGVPLSKSVTWRGPTLWLTLSVIGIVAIVVASALERGHERVGQMVRRIDEMTAGWERISRLPGREDETAPPSSSELDEAGETRRPESVAR